MTRFFLDLEKRQNSQKLQSANILRLRGSTLLNNWDPEKFENWRTRQAKPIATESPQQVSKYKWELANVKNLENLKKMEEILLFLSLLTPLGISMTRAGLGPRKTFVLALLRPFLQLTIGTLAFWLLGSGFVSQGNAFIGYENFLFLKTESDSLFQVRRFIIKENIFGLFVILMIAPALK